MNDDDREELLWRRISEKVSDGVDRQIKGRYFWAALVFAGISWFGGAALITSIVQLRVADKMEPAQAAIAQEKVLADQLTNSLNEAKKGLSDAQKGLSDAQKETAKLNDSLKETKQQLDVALNNEGSLKQQLASLQSEAELAISQFNDRIKTLGQVVAQGDAKQETKAEAVAKLDSVNVDIRLGGDVPRDLAERLASKIKSGGKFTVTIEGGRVFVGGSALRYYYKEDEALAREIATSTTEVLRQFGIDNKVVQVVDLSGTPIKPPERTLQIWLNVSNGKLL